MKNLFVICLLCLCNSCAMHVIPLKGTYHKEGYTFSTELSKAAAWDTLINFFTREGIGLKTLDKADGVLITDKVSFLKHYTWENANDAPTDSLAYVVCSKYRDWTMVQPTIRPSILNGAWMMHLYEQNNHTYLQINLANTDARIAGFGQTANATNNTTTTDNLSYNIVLEVRSTGIFENKVRSAIDGK